MADAFDAMTSTRSYSRARPVPVALAELERCAGAQFDPSMVRALVDAIGRTGWHPVVTSDEDLQVIPSRAAAPGPGPGQGQEQRQGPGPAALAGMPDQVSRPLAPAPPPPPGRVPAVPGPAGGSGPDADGAGAGG